LEIVRHCGSGKPTIHDFPFTPVSTGQPDIAGGIRQHHWFNTDYFPAGGGEGFYPKGPSQEQGDPLVVIGG